MRENGQRSNEGIQGLNWVKDDIQIRVEGGQVGSFRRPSAAIRSCTRIFFPLAGVFLLMALIHSKMPCAWEHPYQYQGKWLKGSIHFHTRRHTASMVMSLYQKMGFDFVAPTEWSMYAEDMGSLSKQKDLLVLPASETGWGTKHLLVVGKSKDYLKTLDYSVSMDVKASQAQAPDPYGFDQEVSFPVPAQDPQEVLEAIIKEAKKDDCFVVAAHPHYYANHFSFEQLLRLDNLDAIEIHNSLTERLLALKKKKQGSGSIEGQSHDATKTWDALLSRGKRIWGVAGDDFLDLLLRTPGDSWIMLLANEFTQEGILDSLKNGRFYASTGVNFQQLSAKGRSILVETDRIGLIQFVGKDGALLKSQQGIRSTYRLQGSELYVRVEVEGNDGTRAWSQPFYPRKKG